MGTGGAVVGLSLPPAVLGATWHRELTAMPNVDPPDPKIRLRQIILSLCAFFFDSY